MTFQTMYNENNLLTNRFSTFLSLVFHAILPHCKIEEQIKKIATNIGQIFEKVAEKIQLSNGRVCIATTPMQLIIFSLSIVG